MGIDFLEVLLYILISALFGILSFVGYCFYSRKNRNYLHPNEVMRGREKLIKKAISSVMIAIAFSLFLILSAIIRA